MIEKVITSGRQEDYLNNTHTVLAVGSRTIRVWSDSITESDQENVCNSGHFTRQSFVESRAEL